MIDLGTKGKSLWMDKVLLRRCNLLHNLVHLLFYAFFFYLPAYPGSQMSMESRYLTVNVYVSSLILRWQGIRKIDILPESSQDL